MFANFFFNEVSLVKGLIKEDAEKCKIQRIKIFLCGYSYKIFWNSIISK